MALTDTAHALIRSHFSDIRDEHKETMNLAVDATCGNGNDTLFLAQLGFKTVIGFDIQEIALQKTRQRLLQAGISGVMLHQFSHEHLADYVSPAIDCLVFNFGYLPSADKAISTKKETSLMALQQGLQLLSTKGNISMLCYPGHSNGMKETTAIQQWINKLSADWKIDCYQSQIPTNKTPVLYTIQKSTS